MKRKSKLLAFLLLILFIKIDYVDAIDAEYIGGSNPPSGATMHSACCNVSSSDNRYCMYNNNNHKTIRITLVKWTKVKQNGKWVEKMNKIGHSVYYSSASYKIEKVYLTNVYSGGTKAAEVTKTGTDESRIRYRNTWFTNKNGISSAALKKELVSSTSDITNRTWSIIKSNILKGEAASNWSMFKSKTAFDDYLKDLSEQDAPSNNEKESMADYEKYRLLIEPVFSFFVCKNGKWEYYTAKGYGVYDHPLTNSTRICEIAGALYTDKQDIGIYPGKVWGSRDNCSTSGKSNSWKTLKNYKSGEGYNILKLSNTEVPPKKYCDYTKDEYFKKNIKGQVEVTSKKGSGPNGENCCNIDDETVWKAYQKQWKREHNGASISKADFKVYLLNTLKRTYCFKAKNPEPEEVKATCSLNNEAGYSNVMDAFDMMVLAAKETGTSSVSSRQSANSKYRRQTISRRGWIDCGEELKLTLPIQYQDTVYRGSKLEWPTYDNTKRSNNYPLELYGKATCNLTIDYAGIVNDYTKCRSCNCGKNGCGRCCKVNWSGVRATVSSIKSKAMDWKNNTAKHYDVNGNFFVKYNDKTYGGTFPITRYSNGQKSYKYTGFSFGNSGGAFTITQHTKYKINQNVYRYVLKLTSELNKSVSYKPTGQNYIDIGYGNLPIADDAKEGLYNVTIQYNNLGGFSSLKYATSTKLYTCPYEVVKTIECVCPPGTKNAGQSLLACMSGGVDGKQYTCAEAQEKFCNTELPKYECPENTRNAGKDITDYVKSSSYEAAVKKYCDSDTALTKCPSGTTYEGMTITKSCYNSENCRRFTCNVYKCPSKSDHPGMVINVAISEKMKVKSCAFQTAYTEVVNTVCYEGKDKIIYRVIDLKNPFPGKKGNGRTPGSNWNNKNYIENYITNNRGVKDNKVYNKQKAMYHFTLTPSDIKQIRAYNKNNKYSDFKLTCKSDGGRECISDFVHNPLYGLKSDSQCYNSGSFNSCR